MKKPITSNRTCAMRWPALSLTAILLLNGCATVSFECGSVKDYPPEIQSAAADELRSLPANSVIATLIADYGVMRAEARACREAGPMR